jgi:hypothetical protein
MKLEFYRQVFEKYSNVWKFFQWEPSYSMRMDIQTDRQADMTKLIVIIRSFANAPKNINIQILENTTHHDKMFKRDHDVVSEICPPLL